MRRTLAILLFVGACSGKSGSTTPTAASGATTAARGTAYFPGLDWGMTTDAATAIYPDLSSAQSSWQTEVAINGAPGVLSLTFGDAGLSEGTWRATDGLSSADACGPELARWRTAIDAELGPSSTDEHGAPEWTTDTAAVSVICDEDALGGEWRVWLSAFPR